MSDHAGRVLIVEDDAAIARVLERTLNRDGFAARVAGETKYPFRKMFRLAINAITGFSYFPLQLATYVGFISAGIAAIAIPIVIYMRMTGSQAFFGQATTLIAVLFLGGVQLICVGILGEYIGRLYDEAKGRPLYIVREGPDESETAIAEQQLVAERQKAVSSDQ